MPERTCSVDGCTRTHRARGLCSTHYNQANYTADQRHAKTMARCTWCGVEHVKEKGRERRYGGLFCSLACRDFWRKATGTNPEPTAEARRRGLEVRNGRRSLAIRKLARAERGTTGTSTWVAGLCHWCRTPFVSVPTMYLGQYCSDRCKSRAKASRRRAVTRGAYHEPYVRADIFRRDHWRCHICRRPTRKREVVPHPLAPVVDHLVPLAEGGDDTAANVATAHFMCNSIKRECGGGEQLALFG